MDEITIRELVPSDYYKGFLDLLEQLTIVESNNITYEEFMEQYRKTNNKIYVIYHKNSDKIVGTGSILIEHKFIRKLGRVGHIEDIVVDKEHRNKQYGTLIIDKLVEESRKNKCYKVILDCDKETVGYYRRYGFKEKGKYMAIYL